MPLTELIYCVTFAFTVIERDNRICINAPAHSTALMQDFLANHRITKVCQHLYSLDLAPCYFWFFPKLKSPFKSEKICESEGHTVHKLSQRRLTADWLAPRESDPSRMRSKVSSDWMPSYIKATRTFLEIFRMAGYFPDSPRRIVMYTSEMEFCYTLSQGHLTCLRQGCI